jgi:hypothetical protein
VWTFRLYLYMSCLTVMATFTKNLFLQAKQFTNTPTVRFSSTRRTKSAKNIQIIAEPWLAGSMHGAFSVQQFLPPNNMAVVSTLLTCMSLCYIFFLRKKLQPKRQCSQNVPDFRTITELSYMCFQSQFQWLFQQWPKCWPHRTLRSALLWRGNNKKMSAHILLLTQSSSFR